MTRVLWALCVLGCGEASGDLDAGGATDVQVEARIEVGGGLLAFEPFGEEAEMVMGIQGGWHIDVSTRFYGIDAVDLQLFIVGVDPETGEQLTLTVDRVLQERHTQESASGVRTRHGDRLILNIDDPSELAGRVLLVRVTGTSTSGVMATGEASVVVVDREP